VVDPGLAAVPELLDPGLAAVPELAAAPELLDPELAAVPELLDPLSVFLLLRSSCHPLSSSQVFSRGVRVSLGNEFPMNSTRTTDNTVVAKFAVFLF
jgi:hypothetical protein